MLATGLLATGRPALSQGKPVALELVLAIDASLSVDREEFALQTAGLVQAFRDPSVIAAIEAAGEGGIVVSMVQWADAWDQVVALDWTAVGDAASAEAFARRIAATPRLLVGASTSITGALKFTRDLFETNGYEGRRKVIDLSGDGRHNQGVDLALQRDLSVAAGITINALVVLDRDSGLGQYFRDQVIGGPGAFAIEVRGFSDFPAGIARKLIREIGGPPLAARPQNPPLSVVLSTLPSKVNSSFPIITNP